MKFVDYLLIFILLAFPYHPASATPLANNAITLTSDEVDSADDIEAAIIRITSSGNQPGTVILDGQNGVFVMTGEDQSLNIFVSNLTLRGVNGAMIVNCDDGLFFDDFPLQQILVEGITFMCTGDGVEAMGDFQEVMLRDNIFWVENNGIGAKGHSDGWLISHDFIQAGGDRINLSGVGNVIISNDDLSGNNGVVLLRSTQSQVRHNVIHAAYQGILLGQESWENVVQANSICGVLSAGIALEPRVVDNRIIANRVKCAPHTTCLTVDGLTCVVESNKIAGNKP